MEAGDPNASQSEEGRGDEEDGVNSHFVVPRQDIAEKMQTPETCKRMKRSWSDVGNLVKSTAEEEFYSDFVLPRQIISEKIWKPITMATPSPHPINLVSVDGKVFSVDPAVAKMSTVLRDMVAICEEAEEGVKEPPITLNVTADILKMVLQWCEQNYWKEGATEDKKDKKARQLEKWDEHLYAITRTADYLNIEGLLNICTNEMANQIKGKSSLEIRKFFGLSEAGSRGEGEDLFCLDSVHLREIIPEGVWILVIKKQLQKIPCDLENLANSSSYFQYLLFSERTAFLFEKVFSLVAPSVWKKEGLEGLPVSEVLQLRRVCSQWNGAIDKLIAEKFQHFDEETSYVNATQNAFEQICINDLRRREFQGFRGQSISRFLRHFETTHPVIPSKRRNPFIWGHLKVGTHDAVRNGIEYKHNLNKISELLSKYGSYLHKLEITFGPENFSSISNKLRAWLLDVPNLKQLRIACCGEELLRTNWMGNYKWKFPKLNHLEELHLFSLPAPIFNQLIRQNHQISLLTIHQPNEDYKFFTFPLSNLKNLELEIFKPNIMDKLRSPVVQWPLESLTLRYSTECDDEFTAFLKIIQEKFATTLVNLDLHMTARSVGKDSKTFRFELPNLKKFTLACCFIEEDVGLDFLLPMGNNLEEIKVDFYEKISFEKEKIVNGPTIVQFIGFEEKMLDSNVWDIFKKMKKITVISRERQQHSFERFKYYYRKDWLQKNGTV